MDAKKKERDAFEWEQRYFVFKISDLIKLTPTAQEYLAAIGREVAAIREEAGKKPLECVVIESDWPEYEPAWRMIQDRVTGSAALAQPAQGEAWTLDKARRYVIRYNDDGEFGQVTGWLYSFADDFYEDGTPAYVWRKLPVAVESISPVTGMTPTQQRIHDLECQAETDKAVIEQLLAQPPADTIAVPRSEWEQLLRSIKQADEALAYAAFNIDGSKLENLPEGIIESTGAAETALIAQRDLRAAIKSTGEDV